MKKVLIGLMSGIISGMFSAGGGIILVPIFIYFFKLSEQQSRATSIFCVLPMVLVTAIMYSNNNYINWELGIKCAIGGVIGGIIGSKLLNKIPVKFLKIFFIVLLFYAAISLIFR